MNTTQPEAPEAGLPEREAFLQLLHIGGQMSNLCFNWSQEANRVGATLEGNDRSMLSNLRKQWDEARAAIAQHRAQEAPAVRDVLAERRRQVEVEGWSPAHDDLHGDESMSIAAACYALATPRLDPRVINVRWLWGWTGWADSWFKPKDRRRNLVRAAALLLAEIERLDRATPHTKDATA